MIKEREAINQSISKSVTKVEVLTPDELAEDIDMLIWQQGKEQFTITEDFLRQKKRTIHLNIFFNIEVEDSIIMFINSDDVVLSFLSSSVQKITKESIDDTVKFIITFKNGNIEILCS